MDPHLLRTFICVVSMQSFSAAAQKLGYTQSAVSQHIAALETSLGVQLVRRRPVAATAAGARLLEHAEPILLRIAAARADVARLTSPTTPVRLAVTSLALVPAVAAVLPSNVELCGASRDQSVTGVARGEFDAALVAGATAPSDPLRLTDTGPISRHPITAAAQPLAVVLPLDHPLADRRSLRLADLSGSLWIDAPNAAIPLSDLWPHAARTSIRYNGADVFTVLALAAAGHGLTLMPASLASAPGLCSVPISEPRLTLRVEVIARSATDPLLDIFR